jgi:hypothetical protein
MTNLIDDTETTGRRLFEPFALALLAAGGVSASVARSDGGSEQPGLIVPPLTAQAHAAESPAPETAITSTPAALTVQGSGGADDQAEALGSEPATSKPLLSSTAPNPNRFAEVFTEVGAAPASLALERPQPEVAVAVKAPAEAGLSALADATKPTAAEQLVPESIAPALQLVAIEPVPANLPVSATAAAEIDSPGLALNPGSGSEPVPLVAPSAVPAEPVQLAAAPVVTSVEAVTAGATALLGNGAPAPMAEALATPLAPASAEPAALVPPLAAAVEAPGPIALALAEAGAETPKRTFVSEPVVQQVPVAAALRPIAPASARPVVTPTRPTAAPPPRLAKAKAPRGSQIGGTIASNFQLTDGTIDYRIGARVNGGEPASLPLRISRDDQLSVKLGDLLTLVKPQMDPALYAYLAATRGAEEYVTFAAIRSSGVDIRYDAARDQLLLGVE